MKLQDDNYSCGPCAIHNALKALGRDIPVDEIEDLAGTTQRDGTDEWDIKAALNALGFDAEVIDVDDDDRFWFQILLAVGGDDGHADPVIINTDSEEHWVAAVGMFGERLIVFDSDNTRENWSESGVHVLDKEELFEMAGTARYALRVVPQFRSMVAGMLKEQMV